MLKLKLVCIWYCATLLWLSGAQHASNNFHFFGNVLDYHLVSEGVAMFVAAILPWVHLMLAGAIVTLGTKSRTPFVATALLGTVFLAAQISVVCRGIPVDCGCFGALAEREVGLVSLCIASSLILSSFIGAMLGPNSEYREKHQKVLVH